MVFARPLSRQLGRSSTLLSAARSSRPAFRPTPLAGAFSGARTLTASASRQGKILMVLYDVCFYSPPPLYLLSNIV